MAENVEYKYDPKTKTYVTQTTGLVYIGAGRSRSRSDYISSFTASQISQMGLKAFTKDGKVTVQVPLEKALVPEKAKAYRAKRDAGLPREVDPVSLKPLAGNTSITTKVDEPFVAYENREYSYNSELRLVSAILKGDEKSNDPGVPVPGYYLYGKTTDNNKLDLQVIDPDSWRVSLQKQFIKNPDEIITYKQKLKDAGYNIQVDNKLDNNFFDFLSDVAANATEMNFYSSQAGAPTNYDLEKYLDYMAAGGGRSNVTAQIDLSTENELYSTINSQFEKYLGKRVPDQLLQEFIQRVNALESKSPLITSVVGDTTTRTGGGAGIGEREAVQFAREQKGAGAYRGATTYLDALMDYVNRPVFGQ